VVHVFWIIFCGALPLGLAGYGTQAINPSSEKTAIVFIVLAIFSGFLSYLLYKVGMVIGSPVANFYSKNPVAYRKRFVDGLVLRGVSSFVIFTGLAYGVLHLVQPKAALLGPKALLIGAALWGILSYFLKQQTGVFHLINKPTAPFREDARAAKRGDGGSGKFAGFWKEWDFPWIPGCVLLGKSLYKDLWCGYKDIERNRGDDRHILTVAGSRSGKGITRIIPNLLLWQDNVICIDPKGENATVTAHNSIRAQAFVIDPYELVKNVSRPSEGAASSAGKPFRAKYNPLQDIDPYSSTATEEIKVLLEAMVFPQSEQNQEWERTPKMVIGGLIAHVLTSPDYAHDRSLVTVYRIINGSHEDLKTLVIAMRNNHAMGDYIPARGNSLEMVVSDPRQSFMSAIRSSLEWLSYPKIQEVVGGNSDFSMFNIANKPMSIFLCFDMESLENLNRFVRIFFLMAFHAMMHPRSPKTKKVLLLLDEFYVLGRLPILEKGAQYIAGEGVKIWIIIQNIEMIETLYGKAWKNFTDSAGLTEAFALSADEQEGTAKWASNKLGKARSADLKLGDVAKTMETHNLLTPVEIEHEFRRENKRALFFLTGHEPFVLEIKPYWDLFHPDMYKEPPQGVPLSAAQRLIMEQTGWTHTRYFGSSDLTLKSMSSPFDETQRTREATTNAKFRPARPASVPTSKGKRVVPGPGIDGR